MIYCEDCRLAVYVVHMCKLKDHWFYKIMKRSIACEVATVA